MMFKINYLSLIAQYPHLFTNIDTPIRILLDNEEIARWQKKQTDLLTQKSQPKEWVDIGVILDDRYIVVLRDLVAFPDGNQGGFIRIFNRAYLEGGSAGVVVLPHFEDKIVLIQHFRHASRLWHWELPRGFGENGKTSEWVAVNEVKEEIHGEIVDLINLGTFYPNTGLEGHPVNLYFAELSCIGEVDQIEGIKNIRKVTSSEFEAMIAEDDINDSFTMAAYIRAKLRGLI